MPEQKKDIVIVVGTRPNFIKVTRFKEVAAKFPGLAVRIVHTGQHYDEKMADVFFRQFELVPDHFLNIGSGTPIEQMAAIMVNLEKLFMERRPDIVLVAGDVNSTLAAALTANKMGILLGHIESGLRSFDTSMPEEHNRVLTDRITDHYFVTEQSGLEHLQNEGADTSRIHFVGNTMIDTLVKYSQKINASPVLEQLQLKAGGFVLMTMHRPATVDSKDGLEKLIALITEAAAGLKIVFPIHPRTLKNAAALGLEKKLRSIKGLILTEPMAYFSFQKLVKNCAFILTDSGGIQEESTFLRIPCLTLRPNTERPVTISLGTNELLPFDVPLIRERISLIRSGKYKKGEIPPMWDGKATERIMDVINRILA